MYDKPPRKPFHRLSTLRRAVTVLVVAREHGSGGILRKNLVREIEKYERCTYEQANLAVNVALEIYSKNLRYKFSRTVVTYHE